MNRKCEIRSKPSPRLTFHEEQPAPGSPLDLSRSGCNIGLVSLLVVLCFWALEKVQWLARCTLYFVATAEVGELDLESSTSCDHYKTLRVVLQLVESSIAPSWILITTKSLLAMIDSFGSEEAIPSMIPV